MGKRVNFTNEEYARLAEIMERLTRIRAASSVTTKMPSAKTVAELSNKFTMLVRTLHEGGQDVILKRQHLRFLEEALATSSVILKERTIPAYKAKEGTEEYVKRAEAMLELYSAILEKIRKAL